MIPFIVCGSFDSHASLQVEYYLLLLLYYIFYNLQQDLISRFIIFWGVLKINNVEATKPACKHSPNLIKSELKNYIFTHLNWVYSGFNCNRFL